MKPTYLATLTLALLLLAAPSAARAGEPVLSCDSSVVAPGDSVLTSVTLTNDSDRPMKLRIHARVRGDRELGGRGHRGRRQKVKLRLDPHETVVQDLYLEVPADAEGPLVADLKVRGRGMRARLEHGLFAGQPDRPETPEAPEPVKLSGAVTLLETEMPPLTLEVAGAETYGLVGPQAMLLAKLMADADLERIEAEIEGVVLGAPEAGGPMHLEVELPLLLVLAFASDEVSDPRESLVRFQPVLAGRDSEITEAETLVVDTDEDWQALLDRAGIERPEPSEEVEPWSGHAGSPMLGRGHHGRHGHHLGAPGPMPLPVIKIDFESRTVLAIFAGEQAAGHHVRILSVEAKEEGGILCRYSVDPVPGPAPDEAAPAIHPYVAVAIDKTEEPVEFLLVE